jgi:hypothetical protein
MDWGVDQDPVLKRCSLAGLKLHAGNVTNSQSRATARRTTGFFPIVHCDTLSPLRFESDAAQLVRAFCKVFRPGGKFVELQYVGHYFSISRFPTRRQLVRVNPVPHGSGCLSRPLSSHGEQPNQRMKNVGRNVLFISSERVIGTYAAARWLAGLAFAFTLSAAPACDASNGGITLPAGFCALLVADNLGPARHLAVAQR